jgi:hypothetical protein
VKLKGSFKANFNSLTQGIIGIQEKGASLESFLTLLKKIESELKTGRGEVRRRVSKKLESVLGRNVGYNTLCHISKVLVGEEELTASDLVYFKYATVVSVDVERSFSRYKNVLSDNRHSLTFDKLRQLVVVYCNIAE